MTNFLILWTFVMIWITVEVLEFIHANPEWVALLVIGWVVTAISIEHWWHGRGRI